MAADLSFLERLDSIPWGYMDHANGPAEDVPQLLRELTFDDDNLREEAFNALMHTIFHQGTVYEATVHAVPFLIEMLRTPIVRDKHRIVYLLRCCDNGTSYHEVHRHPILTPGSGTPEYEAKVRTELGWVQQIRDTIRSSFDAYLPLLFDPDRTARLYIPHLLLSLRSDKPEPIRRAAVAAFEQETDEPVKAGHLLLMALCGEDVAPRWPNLLANDAEPTVRLIAALQMVIQRKKEAPPEAVDLVLRAIQNPQDPEWAGYSEVPTVGDLVAFCGNVLTQTDEATLERALRVIIEGLQTQPDVNLSRIEAMFNLACHTTKSNPFDDPIKLTPLQYEVAQTAYKQLQMDVMSGYINYYDLLKYFGLPDRLEPFEQYLAAGKTR